MVTHRPYRGLNMKHASKSEEEQSSIPTICAHYGYLTNHGENSAESKGLTQILCLKDKQVGDSMYMVCPRKGTEFQWTYKRAALCIDSLGYNKTILKTNQEKAIVEVRRGYRGERGRVGHQDADDQ